MDLNIGYGKIISRENKIIKDLGQINFFKKGYWIEEDSKFLFSDADAIKLYDYKTNTVSNIYSAVNDLLFNQERNEIIFLDENQKYIKEQLVISKKIGKIDLDEMSVKILMNLDSTNLSIGVHESDLPSYGLKIDKIDESKCYSFFISRNDNNTLQVERWYMNFKGEIIDKLKL